MTTSGAGTFSPTCSPHNRAMSVKSRRILALTYAVADKQLNLKPVGGHSFLVWAFIPVKNTFLQKPLVSRCWAILKTGIMSESILRLMVRKFNDFFSERLTMNLAAAHPFGDKVIHQYMFENAVFDVFLT